MVVGAGGHAKAATDVIEQNRDGFQIAGYIVSDPENEPGIGAYPVLGSDAALAEVFQSGVRSAFVAIGNNAARRGAVKLLEGIGFSLVSIISDRAIISKSATLGRGVLVMPGAVINAGSTIGDGAIINTGAIVDHDCSIGAYSHIAPGCSLAGSVSVGEGVLLGVGACVIPGIAIGEWATVGAGGVVVSPLPPHVTAVGVPARIVPNRSHERP